MLIKRYGEKTQFLVQFNPSFQREICSNPQECFFGDYPTLAELKGYGDNFPTAWLIPQLNNLSEYCGSKDKLDGEPLEECAFVIATEFYYLKVSEIMLFLHRFKAGRYGILYNSVDPLKVMQYLRKFIQERIYAYDRREQEERERQAELARKNAISYAEYRKMHPLPERPKPEKKKEEEDVASVLWVAESLLNDPRADENCKAQYTKIFKQKYGLTPQEYLAKYSKQ